MYDLFLQHFNQKVPLSAQDTEIIKTYLSPKKLRKRQYLLQEGDVCRHIAFVTKGALRSYTIEENGTERIMQFAVEGWTIADLYSFLTGEPATHNIDALEDTELVLISRAAHEELLLKLDKYETYMRLLVTGAYLALQKRFNATVSHSPEEQYTSFISRYPEIAGRVPQHMIASYLGLTPETISRLRRKIATRR
ncbi:MAG: Crp/Fnr family transcriptional regulator [Sphingobacteriaceae bacterium]|nr:MAG: Crp/Fnr family transcriptional regulator [Sphingobacteriaceae bacterium]